MNSNRTFLTLIAGLFLSLAILAGCEDDSPMEEIGDGFEEMGDGIEEAANDAQREIEDATD